MTDTVTRTQRLIAILKETGGPLTTVELARRATLTPAQVHAALKVPLSRGLVARMRRRSEATTVALNGRPRPVHRPEVVWSLTRQGAM